MKSFKDYVTMNEAKIRDTFELSDDDVSKIKRVMTAMDEPMSPVMASSLKRDIAKLQRQYGMTFKEMHKLVNEAFKKGDSVTIKNAKSYDAMMKDTAEGTVIGTMGSKVMVKVGSGQLNVDPKDITMNESGYVVTVAVRDARAANELAKDSYRNLYKNDGSDVFVFKKESDKEDFEDELLDMGLEVLEEAVKLDEADFSKIKPLIDKDIKQIRDNLFEDSKTISKVWRTFNAYPGDVDTRTLKSLQEVEQLMDKARQILTKI